MHLKLAKLAQSIGSSVTARHVSIRAHDTQLIYAIKRQWQIALEHTILFHAQSIESTMQPVPTAGGVGRADVKA